MQSNSSKLKILSIVILLLGLFITAWSFVSYNQIARLQLIDLDNTLSGSSEVPLSLKLILPSTYIINSLWGLSIFWTGQKCFKSIKYGWKLNSVLKTSIISIVLGIVALSFNLLISMNYLSMIVLALLLFYYMYLRFNIKYNEVK